MSEGLKNEFELAMVNEPSVFESLRFYCIATFILQKKKPSIMLLGMFLQLYYEKKNK